MTNQCRGTLYIGVTNNLPKRVYQHRNALADGFTKKYGLKRLVYYELFHDARSAIQREKNLKHWIRDWKIKLIETKNPSWIDLYEGILSWCRWILGSSPRKTRVGLILSSQFRTRLPWALCKGWFSNDLLAWDRAPLNETRFWPALRWLYNASSTDNHALKW